MWAPKHGTLNPFPATKKYATFPFDGDEPEWRPYIPQHIGLTEIGKQFFGKIEHTSWLKRNNNNRTFFAKLQ